MAADVGDQWHPDRTVVLLAGTPPGGGQDRAARALAASLADLLPVSVEVTNVPGRGGGNAWDRLAAAPGDGHLLAISSPTIVTNLLTGVAELGPSDLTHVAMLCTEYIAFATRAESDIADSAELIARLAAGGSAPVIALATARGNVNHVALARLARYGGTDSRSLDVRVFDSARHAVADVVAGRADIASVSAASVLPEVAKHSLRVLAVSAPQRLAAPLDTVPTWVESGVPCVIGTWRGVAAPPDIDATCLGYWHTIVARAVNTPAWREALERHVWTPTFRSPAETGEFLAAEEGTMREALLDLALIDG